MSKNVSNWPYPECKDRILANENYSLLLHKGSSKEKTKNNRSKQICSKYFSLLSTLMRYLKNISNSPDQRGQRCDMSQNYSQHKDNFPSKNRKQEKHTNML